MGGDSQEPPPCVRSAWNIMQIMTNFFSLKGQDIFRESLKRNGAAWLTAPGIEKKSMKLASTNSIGNLIQV